MLKYVICLCILLSSNFDFFSIVRTKLNDKLIWKVSSWNTSYDTETYL